MLTDNDRDGLNRLSARITALETMVAWLLYDHLKRSRDPTLADRLIAQAMPTDPQATGKAPEFIENYARSVESLVRQAERLLHATR